MESWNPVDDKELAFMFEDDIEVSKDYFDYALASLRRHIFTGPRGERDKSYHARHMIGIALTTPRYDETSVPRKQWTPDKAIGVEEPFFLFQLACSWGALYFPWSWRNYLSYYQWRRPLELPKKLDVIPYSYVNSWERSWKRYLQELMFITGLSMLYPNLPNQASFSTHHREIGEHTQGRPLDPEVDAIGTNSHPHLTVPLLQANDTEFVQSLVFGMKRLDELPVVNFYHNLTDDLYSLAELGFASADMMREFGLNQAMINKNPTCILDWANYLGLKKKKKSGGQQFLSFIPQGNILQQLDQLRNAIAMAYSLQRTLLLPDHFMMANQSMIPIDQLISLHELGNLKFVKIKHRKDLVGGVELLPKRLVAFLPFDSQGRRAAEPLIPTEYQKLRHIKLTLSWGTDLDTFRWFSGCNDELLMFSQINVAFSQFVNLTENEAFDALMSENIVLSQELQEILHGFNKIIGDSLCLEMFRPEKYLCRPQNYEGNKYWKSVYYRNCNATTDRLLRYGESWWSELKLQNITDSLYILGKTNTRKVSHQSTKGDLIPVYSQFDLKQRLKGEMKGLEAVQEEFIMLLEEELCANSVFFLGNAYSPRAKRIVDKRKIQGLPTALLGMGMIAPFRNETLPGSD